MQNERSVHATGVFRDPMRACHADPIAEGHYAPAPTLPSSSSTVKASEKETIPDANDAPSSFSVDSLSL